MFRFLLSRPKTTNLGSTNCGHFAQLDSCTTPFSHTLLSTPTKGDQTHSTWPALLTAPDPRADPDDPPLRYGLARKTPDCASPCTWNYCGARARPCTSTLEIANNIAPTARRCCPSIADNPSKLSVLLHKRDFGGLQQ